MPRYVAFLRGVSPMNATMPALKSCFEAAGFNDVRTVLASGNVAFTARASTDARIERTVEAAMTTALGRTFYTIVRRAASLQALLDADPFRAFEVPVGAKRVVTFLREPPTSGIVLPVAFDGARILGVSGRDVFTAYVPSPRGPAFMTLIEKTFGTLVTTRTWDTVRRCAGA